MLVLVVHESDGLFLEDAVDAPKFLKPNLSDHCCWACVEKSNGPLHMMIVCPKCGFKRCPKASDHTLECTGKNDAGQPGSVYKKEFAQE